MISFTADARSVGSAVEDADLLFAIGFTTGTRPAGSYLIIEFTTPSSLL